MPLTFSQCLIDQYLTPGILNENENLNRRLLMQEEDFRVQNQTLLLELTNLSAENEALRLDWQYGL